MVMTLAGLNPGLTDRKRRKPLISNPAPTSRMSARASTAVTRKLRNGLREMPVALVRPFSRKASATSPRGCGPSWQKSKQQPRQQRDHKYKHEDPHVHVNC